MRRIVVSVMALALVPALGVAQQRTDSSTIAPDGTATVTRVVPVPKTVSAEAQAMLGRVASDANVPQTLEQRRTGTDKWQAGAGEVSKRLYPANVTEATIAGVPVFLQPMTAPPTLKPEGAKLDAYFNMDNGTGKLLGVYTEGNVGIGAIFQQWMAPLKDLGMTTVSQRNTGATDHVPFQMAGLPGFQFIQDPRDYDSRTHHTNLDTYEHLSEPDLKQAAVVEAIFLYDAAMRDAMLPRSGVPFNSGSPDKPLEGLYPDAGK